MFKFLKNLFNIGKKKSLNSGSKGDVVAYKDSETEIIVNKDKGSMIVKTSKNLSDNDIIDIFRKYVLGEED